MKNFLAGALTCSLAFTLVACGGGSSGGGKTKSSAALSSAPATFVSSVVVSSSPTSSAVSSVIAGSDASSSSSNSSAPVAQTGVFVDSAVAGVTYTTTPGGFTGVTSPAGQYQYAEGDTVVFSIGELKFPAAPARGVVTPADLAHAADPQNADRIKTNIAALLQTLDTDGNPENGITVGGGAAASASQVDFNQPYSTFATLPAVTTLVANSGSPTTTLVSETAARAHLEESMKKLLVGAWYVKGDTYQYALIVIDGERYAAIDTDNDTLGADATALELGTYSWDQATGKVSVILSAKTDGDLDARPPLANGNTLVLDGNTLTLTDDGSVDGEPSTFVLTRLMPTAESPLQGGWLMESEESVVAFAFTGSDYLMGEMSEEDKVGQPGAEVGTYTYNVETNEVVVKTLADTNGQWGLSHPCAVLDLQDKNDLACGPGGRDIVQTLTVTGDTLTFISEADTIAFGEEEEYSFERINGVPDGDIHLKLALTMTLVEYSQGQLYSKDNGSATMQCDMYEEREVGDVETAGESWVLGSKSGRPTWLSTQSATYDPATGSISFDVHEPKRLVREKDIFSQEFWDSFEGQYTPGQTEVISGTYTERYDLTWSLDNSVSSCTATYEVTGVLR